MRDRSDLIYNWEDLRERLLNAVEGLGLLRGSTDNPVEQSRLDAKASGVRLALSYMEEYDRDEPVVVFDFEQVGYLSPSGNFEHYVDVESDAEWMAEWPEDRRVYILNEVPS